MILDNLPDAPDIARTLRTGYPHSPEKHECCICGAPARCYGAAGGYLCFDCARQVFAALSDEEAVEALGFEVLSDE